MKCTARQIRFVCGGPTWALVVAEISSRPKRLPRRTACGDEPLAVAAVCAIRWDWEQLLWIHAYIVAPDISSATNSERVAARLWRFSGAEFSRLLLGGLLLYIGWKYINRQRFLRRLRIARITPTELQQRMQAGESVIIVDLRHTLEFESDPETIPGAVHMDAAELEEALEVIPRDREIVLFCSCPNEATAAQMALRLRNLGITRIRPLAGRA